MSQAEDRHEAERWLATAEEDLRAANTLQKAGMFAHVCFMCQQCGEKAVKAMWYGIGESPWGHSIQRLITQFPDSKGLPNLEELIQRSAALDKYYVPTRYPNGLPDLTPEQSYFLQDAEAALEQAAFFLKAVREFLSTT